MQLVDFLVIRTSRPCAICHHPWCFAAVEVISVCVVCYGVFFQEFVSPSASSILGMSRNFSATSKAVFRLLMGSSCRETQLLKNCTGFVTKPQKEEKKNHNTERKGTEIWFTHQFYEAELVLESKQVRGFNFGFLHPVKLFGWWLCTPLSLTTEEEKKGSGEKKHFCWSIYSI